MYKFINNSIVEIRDVEAPILIQMDTIWYLLKWIGNHGVLDNAKEIVGEVENIAGKLNWNVVTLYWKMA